MERKSPAYSHPQHEWQDWMQPTPATAEQVDQLLGILKPLPRSLITLKQMLDLAAKKTDRIDTACTNSLMSLQSLNEYFQENQSSDTSLPTLSLRQIEISLKQQTTMAEQTRSQILDALSTSSKSGLTWKTIGSRICEGAAIALTTWMLIQFSPIGLNHINLGINNLLIKVERLAGGKQQ